MSGGNAQNSVELKAINNEKYKKSFDPNVCSYSINKIFTRSKKIKDENNSTRLSFGLGTATALGTNKFSYLISINGIFNLGSILYLEPGLDIFPEPRYKADTFTNFDLILLAGFSILRNKVTLFAGGGGFVYLPFGVGAPVGLLASLRAEYNVSKKSSLGLEVKHPNYLGTVSKDNPILLISISHTFKL